MCEFWEERKQSLEKAVEEKRKLQGRLEKSLLSFVQIGRRMRKWFKNYVHRSSACMNRETYKCLQDQIHSTDKNCLLLPSIPNLEGQNPEELD